MHSEKIYYTYSLLITRYWLLATGVTCYWLLATRFECPPVICTPILSTYNAASWRADRLGSTSVFCTYRCAHEWISHKRSASRFCATHISYRSELDLHRTDRVFFPRTEPEVPRSAIRVTSQLSWKGIRKSFRHFWFEFSYFHPIISAFALTTPELKPPTTQYSRLRCILCFSLSFFSFSSSLSANETRDATQRRVQILKKHKKKAKRSRTDRAIETDQNCFY